MDRERRIEQILLVLGELKGRRQLRSESEKVVSVTIPAYRLGETDILIDFLICWNMDKLGELAVRMVSEDCEVYDLGSIVAGRYLEGRELAIAIEGLIDGYLQTRRWIADLDEKQ